MKILLPTGHTAQSIASACGVHLASIYRAVSGGPCGSKLATLIHYATNGAIPCWSLRPDLWTEGQIPPVPDRFRAHDITPQEPAA